MGTLHGPSRGRGGLMRRSQIGIGAAIAIAALMVAGSASALSAPRSEGADRAPATTWGMVVDPAAVPWGDVGWVELVTWQPHPSSSTVTNDVELVAPWGTAYPIFAADHLTDVIAWAGDRRDALLANGDLIRVLDLETGTIVDSFRVPPNELSGATFTWPEGLALYLDTSTGTSYVVHTERTTLSGKVEVRFPPL